jgi:mRNA interferase RelE/StbE
MFDVKLNRRADRFLDKCHKLLAERITKKIEDLRINPFLPEVKRITGSSEFRVRVGDYRILYEIFHNENLIVITRIDHRSRIYGFH